MRGSGFVAAAAGLLVAAGLGAAAGQMSPLDTVGMLRPTPRKNRRAKHARRSCMNLIKHPGTGDGAENAAADLRAKLAAVAAVHAGRQPGPHSRQVLRRAAILTAKKIARQKTGSTGNWRSLSVEVG